MQPVHRTLRLNSEEASGTKGYTFKPKQLTVTLTKVDGTPRVDMMYVGAEEFQNVKWIRVHRD